MRKISIFWKIYLTLILVAALPVTLSGLQLIMSYRDVIDEIAGGGSQKNLNILQENLFIQGVLTVLFFVITMTTFGALLLTRNLLSPLKKINREMKAVARGKLDILLKVDRKDELGELTQSFNGMVSDLKESRANLEEAKTILEIKVNARTRELKEMTETLEGKVEARTKDLKARLEELERFQKLAIGRELRMVELKGEIEKLEKQFKKNAQKK